VATITRPQKSLALILARGVAANLSIPISVLDADGNLVFFNEAAEVMHGVTFAEAGELSATEWPEIFSPERPDGKPIPLEDWPVGVALLERRPVHTRVQFTGADGVAREIAVTAFPLMGRDEELFGAIAIFWLS
jgi:PAS domain-containing protein